MTNDHIVELVHAAIPPIRGRLTSDAVVDAADPAFVRRAAVGMAPPIDAPAARGAWVREVLAALDQLLAGKLPKVRGGRRVVDNSPM